MWREWRTLWQKYRIVKNCFNAKLSLCNKRNEHPQLCHRFVLVYYVKLHLIQHHIAHRE